MIPKKPTNYDKPVRCYNCSHDIDNVYIRYYEPSHPYCKDCYKEIIKEEYGDSDDYEDENEYEELINENWQNMNRYQYLDKENEREYDEYCDDLLDQYRDDALYDE